MSRGLSQDPPTPNQASLYQRHKPLTHQVPRQACHENVSTNKPVLTHPPVPSYSLDSIKKVCHGGRGSYASFGSIHRSVQWAGDSVGRRCEGWVLTGSEHHNNDESNKEHGQNGAGSALHGLRYMTKVQSPDTPEKPLAYEGPSATYRRLPVDNTYISKPTHMYLPAISI